eukprot:SAG31_NODE_43149_length_268_cov_0.781065_1_plen_44_part_10
MAACGELGLFVLNLGSYYETAVVLRSKILKLNYLVGGCAPRAVS